jgi:hypothetical protein
MPSTGTPSEKIFGSAVGLAVSYTLCGPPERMIPAAPFNSFAGVEGSRISEYAPRARTRRAMRCAYWPPKSRMMMGLRSTITTSEKNN